MAVVNYREDTKIQTFQSDKITTSPAQKNTRIEQSKWNKTRRDDLGLKYDYRLSLRGGFSFNTTVTSRPLL